VTDEHYLLANVQKHNIARFPFELARLALDIAGGRVVTMPFEQDFRSPEVGKWMEKYFKGCNDVPTENRMRILRLIENMTLGTPAVGYPHRVHPWGRVSPGSTDHDPPAGEYGREAEGR
jgi:aromatic ring hydroxylase